mmetsp:Transcript_49043/g.128024  ORF Transcript_49043/g.128024 Transcript_49043/m.128024 type:complete len:253 (+) Transcript_49043:3-761(+)
MGEFEFSAMHLAVWCCCAALAWTPATVLRRWPSPSGARHRRPTAVATSKYAVTVDLGADGEPKGQSRLLFSPLLERSEFLLLELKVPLGMLIEETEKGHIEVTGALPGYSAYDQAQPGDLVRAVTAYREVVGDAPMWQQVISYTPVGKMSLKRLIFRTDDARYTDVRDAIASHRSSEGGNDMVTLVVERSLDANATWAPPEDMPVGLEPLQDVIMRDLKRGRDDEASIDKQLDKLSPSERARRLLGVDDDER